MSRGFHGATGPAGPAGPAGLGRWRGSWTSGVPADGLGAYAENDLVVYQGTTYRANTTPTPAVAPANDVSWDVVAQAGADGANGTSGVSFVYQGDWVSGTPYIIGQWVSYNGDLYYCNGNIGALTTPPDLDPGWNLGLPGGGGGGLQAGTAPQSSIRPSGYLMANGTSIGNTSTIAVNSATASPVYVPKATTADRIALYVQAGTATALWRLGIFADAGLDYLYPGALLYDGGTIDASTTGLKENTIASPVALPAGVYWLAGKAEVVYTNARGNVGPVWGVIPNSANSTGDTSSGYVASHGAGTWTDPWPAWGSGGTGTVQVSPRVAIRVTG